MNDYIKSIIKTGLANGLTMQQIMSDPSAAAKAHRDSQLNAINSAGVKLYLEHRLNQYYKNALIDYNVTGNASVKIEGDKLTIVSTDSVGTDIWSMYYNEDDAKRESKDYYFNCWLDRNSQTY